jgi:mitochondrial fission protein ELM1
LVLSDKGGDNAQVEVIAEALPWPCQVKRMIVLARFAQGKPPVTPSLHHIDFARSDRLEAPWPDLVITIGRRMSMVALWIQEQSQGRTRIALIGAPKGQIDRFDLAVISEQYRSAPRPNTMRVRYPLQRIDRAAVAAETAAWRDELAALPRPLIAVMVGGTTKEVRFDAETAERLGRDLTATAAESGGSLYVTTSRRTPTAVVEALQRTLPADAVLHRWRADAMRNPYRALLGTADRFIVTSDSLSMQMEIARLGRPLEIYRLPAGSWFSAGPLSDLADGILGSKRLRLGLLAALERRLGRFLDWVGSLRHHRDLMAIPRRLVADGYARWFGQPSPADAAAHREMPDELPEVVARLTALMERAPR